MLIWKILGVLLALLLLLMLLRVGVEVSFGAEETQVKLRVGILRFQLLPRKKPPKKKETEKRTGKKAEKAAKPAEKKPKLGLDALKSGAELLLPPLKKALRRTRRAIRIHPLRLHITLGGDDPAAVGQRYGWGQALLWTVMPQAEQLLTIPDPHIRLDADFDGGATRCEGEVGVNFRVGSMVRISLALLPPLLKWLRLLRGAKPAPEKAERTEQTGGQMPPDAARENEAEQGPNSAAENTTKNIADDTTDEKGGHYGK